jgi:hypothetical protein
VSEALGQWLRACWRGEPRDACVTPWRGLSVPAPPHKWGQSLVVLYLQVQCGQKVSKSASVFSPNPASTPRIGC